MDELEQRLRSALTELADEVPPSQNAWAEHERRVAQRAKRARLRPALMAVAAAAAVALIAVPVLLLNTRGDGNELGVATNSSEAPPPSQSSAEVSKPQLHEPTYQPGPGEQVLIPPRGLMGEEAGGESKTIYTYVIRKDGKDMLCIGEGKGYRSVNSGEADTIVPHNCMVLTPPKAGKVVWLKYNVPSQSNKGAWLFVASNNTDRIMLLRAEGGYSVASKFGSTTEFSVFFTVTGSSKPYTNLTAKDPGNLSLEDG